MIRFNPMVQKTFSKDTYELFSDTEWNNFLSRHGFDATRKITYHVGTLYVTVKQWDLPTDSSVKPQEIIEGIEDGPDTR